MPPVHPSEPRHGRIERELGVPFPGREVEPARFTHTRTTLPAAGAAPFDWVAAFGRDAPRVLDLGCGNGRYLIQSALARPEMDHLGIDLVPVAIDFAVRRADRRGLRNVRFAVGDALAFVLGRVAPDSVDEVHLYHPQPYYEPGESKLRMITPALVLALWHGIRRGGRIVLQTDNPRMWRHIETTVPLLFAWERQEGPWPDAPEGRTRREIIARAKRLPIYRGFGSPRRDVPEDEARAIASRLPEPDFDANRRRFAPSRRPSRRPRKKE